MGMYEKNYQRCHGLNSLQKIEKLLNVRLRRIKMQVNKGNIRAICTLDMGKFLHLM